LLRVGGVGGTDAELEDAAEDFGLRALALNLLAAYIYEIPGHHVSNAMEIPNIDVPLKEGKHPRRVMAAFAKRFGDDSAEVELLRIMGLFSSPAKEEEIAALHAAPSIPDLTEHIQGLSEPKWLELITKLRHLKLLAPESRHRPNSLDAHPLVREHFSAQLKGEYPNAWREGHNRLYEYYKTSAKEYPDTLKEMAPLYAAVMHGCQAGRYQETLMEVYWKRILHGNEHFSWKKLGTFGADLAALSGFFYGTSWRKPVDGLTEAAKGFVLNQVGFYLRALNWLAEAAQPMQASLEIMLTLKNWNEAAIRASNLSEFYLTIGDVKGALTYAEQSVELADQSGDEFRRLYNRASLGDVQHQLGQLAESQITFHEAEVIQKKRQPELPLLYSYQGFRYCDLLLSQENYAEVKRRASQTLEWGTREGFLLDIVHDNLSLGRAHLLQSQREPNHPLTESLTYLNRAVDGLRQAGAQEFIARGLLARAEYYRVTGDLDKAQRDLDEAFSIASRGGMGLHLADCRLEYARLALARGPSPRPSPSKGEGDEAREHLKIAKEMIEKMGYHRRDKEVEELEMSFPFGDDVRGTA
jgi:tetratricopeptide (TPR) repeat protein